MLSTESNPHLEHPVSSPKKPEVFLSKGKNQTSPGIRLQDSAFAFSRVDAQGVASSLTSLKIGLERGICASFGTEASPTRIRAFTHCFRLAAKKNFEYTASEIASLLCLQQGGAIHGQQER
jgi:hypothetical protein